LHLEDAALNELLSSSELPLTRDSTPTHFPQHKKDTDLLEWVQRRATKTQKLALPVIISRFSTVHNSELIRHKS